MDIAVSLRAGMRRITENRRTRLCGVARISLEPSIRVRETAKGRACSWHGVMMCNSIHACAVCSSRIRAARREELGRAFAASDAKHAPRMFTLTFRHHNGLPLTELLAGMKLAMRFTRQARGVRGAYDRAVVGTVRAIEVTHGENGWHPHAHLVVLSAEWTDDEQEKLVAAWRKGISKAFTKLAKERMRSEPSGARARYEHAIASAYASDFAPSSNVGVKWSEPRERRKSGAYYLTKLGLELTHIESKESADGSRTPWDIARDACAGDLSSLRLWREYEKAMKGTRLIEMDERMKALSVPQLRDESDDVRPSADVTVPLHTEICYALRKCERVEPLAVRLVERAATTGPLVAALMSKRIDDEIRRMLALAHETTERRRLDGLRSAREGPQSVRRANGQRCG